MRFAYLWVQQNLRKVGSNRHRKGQWWKKSRFLWWTSALIEGGDWLCSGVKMWRRKMEDMDNFGEGGSFLWFSFFFFFSLTVYFQSVNWNVLTQERVLWKVSVYSSHTSQIVHFIFVWKEKKKDFPDNLDINYISNLLFTDKTIFSVSWSFLNIFTALNHF